MAHFTKKLSSVINHIPVFCTMGSDINTWITTGWKICYVSGYAVEEPEKTKAVICREPELWQVSAADKNGTLLPVSPQRFPAEQCWWYPGEIANHASMAETEWSWSRWFADFDNDGWKTCM